MGKASIGWVPLPHVFGYYLLFFTFGALLYGRPNPAGVPIVETIGSRWWLYLGLAVTVFLVGLLITAVAPGAGPAGAR